MNSRIPGVSYSIHQAHSESNSHSHHLHQQQSVVLGQILDSQGNKLTAVKDASFLGGSGTLLVPQDLL